MNATQRKIWRQGYQDAENGKENNPYVGNSQEWHLYEKGVAFFRCDGFLD